MNASEIDISLYASELVVGGTGFDSSYLLPPSDEMIQESFAGIREMVGREMFRRQVSLYATNLCDVMYGERDQSQERTNEEREFIMKWMKEYEVYEADRPAYNQKHPNESKTLWMNEMSGFPRK